jgi:hypothetical protein
MDEFLCRKDLKNGVLGLAAIERSRHRQASHLVWLKEGDVCTHLFHLKTNGRSRKKFISCLKNNMGEYVWSHDEKAAIFQDYFQSILGTNEQRQATIS